MTFLQKFKVSGHSMMPTLKPGREILVSSIPYFFSKPRVGDIIAFSFARRDLANNKPLVKRIKDMKEGKYLVKGDNKEDSREYGWIKRKNILGKVIYIYA